MDQPRHPGSAGGLDNIQCAGDIAALEAFGIGSVDHSGDMDHRIGAVTQPAQRHVIVQIAANPFHPGVRRLLAPGQRADLDTGLRGTIQQSLTDEPGRAGNGNSNSTTI